MTDEIFFDGIRYLSAGDAAHQAGLTRDYIARLCRENKVRGKQVGKNWYASKESLDSFLVKQEHEHVARKEELARKRALEYQNAIQQQGLATSAVPQPAAAKNRASLLPPTPLKEFSRPQRPAETIFARRAGRSDALSSAMERHPTVQNFVANISAFGQIGAAQGGIADAAYPMAPHAASLISPVAEFAHKLTALLVAVSLTFGTYSLVDPHYAREAVKTLSGGISQLAHIDMTNLAADARVGLAAAAADPWQSLWDAGGYLGEMVQRLGARVDAFVRSLSGGVLSDADPYNGSVAVDVVPYSSSSPSPVQPAESAPVGTQTVINNGSTLLTTGNPVIERVVIRETPVERVMAVGGISEDVLDQRLNQLDNKLSSQMFSLSAAQSTVTTQNYYVTAQTNAISNLSRATIANSAISGGTISGASISSPTISGGSISDTSVSATALSVSGATSLATTTITGSLTLSGSSGSISAANADFTNGTTTNATSTNFFSTNASTTNATSTNLFSVLGHFTTGVIDTLSSTLAAITNLTATELVATNATTTNATSTALYVSGLAQLTSLGAGTSTITNLAVTNTSTSTFAGGFTIAGSGFVYQQATGRVGIGTTSPFAKFAIHAKSGETNSLLFEIASSTASATSSLFSISNAGLTTLLNLSMTAGTTTNLFSTTASSTNLFSTNANLGVLTAGTLSLTAGTTTNFFSTTASSTNLFSQLATLGTLSLNAGTTTNLFSTTASSTNLYSMLAYLGTVTLNSETVSGLSTFQSGFVSQASSTIVGAFTTTGANVFGSTLNVSGLTTLGQASTTLFSSYGPAYFGATATSSFSSAGALTLASALAIASGGTATTTQVTNGVNYFDGTRITSGTALTYDGTKFTAPFASSTALSVSGTGYFGTASTTNLTVSSLTLNRVPYITTAGAFTDSGNLTFDGTTLTAANLTSSGNVSLGSATTTNLFSTTASSTNLFSQTATIGTLTVGGGLTSTGLATFTNGFLSNASSTITSGLFSMNGGASTTNLTASGTGYFGLGQFTNTTGTTTIASGQGLTVGQCVTGDTKLRRRRKRRRPDLPASRPRKFFVYAILCDDGSIYIGQTQDLRNRWEEHCSGIGAEHTTKHKPIDIIHYEEFDSREEAVAREKFLKAGFGRKWLKREWKAGRTRQAGGAEEEYFEDVRIDEIKSGDEILTLNEKTGKLVVSRVKELMDMGVKDIYELVTATGKRIKTTGNHPYLVLPKNIVDSNIKNAREVWHQALAHSNSGVGGQNQSASVNSLERIVSANDGRALNPGNNTAVAFGHSRVIAFIDLANIFKGAESEGWEIDYAKLRRYLTTRYGITRALIFGGTSNRPDRVELHERLVRLGYEVLLVPTRYFKDGPPKADVDSRMTFEMMRMEKEYDRAVVFTGDGDFYWVLEYLRAIKEHIWLFGVAARTARDLKRLFKKQFINISTLRPIISENINENGVPVKYTPAFRATDAFDEFVAGVQPSYQNTLPFVKGGSWKKVVDIREGMMIATKGANDKPVYERVMAINRLPAEQVWDIEVEGTHNFIAGHYVNVRTNTALTPEQEELVVLRQRLAFGDWLLDNNRYDEYAESAGASLRAIARLAGKHVVDEGDIQTLVEIPQGGALRHNEPASPRRALGSTQHSGGAEPRAEGLSPLPDDSSRLVQRDAHDTDANDRTWADRIEEYCYAPDTIDFVNEAAARAFHNAAKAIFQKLTANNQLPAEGEYAFGGIVAHNTAFVVQQTSGNVGIGTTSPSTTLGVIGSGYFTSGLGVGVLNTSAGTLQTSGAATIGGALTVNGTGASTIAGPLALSSTTGTTTIASGQGFTVGSSQLVVQQGSGNVGIGTTDPGAKLSIAAGALNVDAEQIRFNRTDDGLRYNSIYSLSQGGGTASISFKVHDAVTTTSQATVMTLLGSGNVGIGTTTPYSLLSLSNSASTAANTPLFTIASTTGGTSTSTLMTVLASGKVGIGTASPISPLQTQQAAAVTTLSNAGPLFLTGPFGASALGGYVGIDFKGYRDASGDVPEASMGFITTSTTGREKGALYFATRDVTTETAPTERMRIDSAGNVGIGTTGPGYKLDIRQTDAFNSLNIQPLTGTNATGLRLTNDGGIGYLFVDNSAGDYSGLGAAGAYDTVLQSGAGQKLYLGAGSATPGMVILPTSGNVGIGTTGPGTVLDVRGANTSTLNPANVSVMSTDSFAIDKGGSIGLGGGYTGGTVTTFGGIKAGKTNATDGDYSGYLAFYSRLTGSVPAERMRIDNSGNVGIGTTGPDAKLDVQMAGTATPTTLANLSSSSLFLSNTGGGTTGSTVGIFGVQDGTPAIASGIGFIRENSADFGTVLTFYTHPADVANGGNVTERMRITSGGNVGIGTTSPGKQLEVVGDIRFGDSTAARKGQLFTSSSGGFVALESITNVPLVLGVNGQENVRIDTSGNVGIGTTSPGAKLDVSASAQGGASGPIIRLTDTYASGAGRNWALSNGYNAYGNFELQTSATEGGNPVGGTSVLTVVGPSAVANTLYLKEGNVGIGTTTPGANLVVNGTTGQNLFQIATSTNQGVFTVNTNGNVGIGTTAPSQALEVVGNIQNTGGNIFMRQTAVGFVDNNATSIGNNGIYYMNRGSGAGLNHILFGNGGNQVGDVTSNTTSVAYNTTSDRRLKENITMTTMGLDTLIRLPVRDFNFIKDPTHATATGFIAQELYEIFPYAVTTNGDNGIDVLSATSTSWGVDYGRLTPLLTKSIQDLNTKFESRTNFISNSATSTALFVDVAGNVGIGTSTPQHRLQVQGDVAAEAFVNSSTRELKTDITGLATTTEDGILEQLATTNVYSYRYKDEPATNPLRVGLIVDSAPTEVLSVNQDGVDIYKLAVFTLAGVKAQERKIAAIDERVGVLEQAIAELKAAASAAADAAGATTDSATSAAAVGASAVGASLAAVLDGLKLLGVDIAENLAHFVKVVADNFQVGSQEHPTGITMYDKSTGEPYCFQVDNGSATTTAGACTDILPAAAATPDLGVSPPSAGGVSSGAPVISLNGNNPATISVGDTYGDLGALITGPTEADKNLGIHTFLDGVAMETIQLDTSVAGEHTIDYVATNSFGTATSTRTVIVEAPANVVVIDSAATSTGTVIADASGTPELTASPTPPTGETATSTTP